MSTPDLETGERSERKGKGASAKSKDLSHVPCKFYRVGACTAGASCPFSHSAPEPGQSKDVCAWFVKGNCKFGHKCALAHVLPGQPMSMDRKNKKAAQHANAANKDPARGRGPKPDRDRRRRPDNALFSGSSAPTRSRSARAPMPIALKATISPSAPAPPISDSDFAMPDEATKLPSAPAARKASPEDAPADAASSPRSAPSTAPSPGTSPAKAAVPSFNLADKPGLRSGIAASLGATRPWADYRLAYQDDAVEEDDLEEFVPGSLSELLSPEERERRYSRTAATSQALNLNPRNGRPSVDAHHHRYSRSVPGVNPIQNMSSIWSDSTPFPSATASPRTAGMPGSYTALAGPRSFADDAQISAFLSPTNASAAFLPGTAHHYMSKNNPLPRTLSDGQRQQIALRGAYASTPPGANAANLLARLNEGPIQPATAGPARTQFDISHTSESLGGAPYIGHGLGPHDQQDMASPSAHALQMHAPGQSLPQGLAAGYSRIHALPPPPAIPSPSQGGGSFVPSSSFNHNHALGDWIGMSPAMGAGLALDGQSPYAMRSGNARPSGPAPVASRTPSGMSWAAPTSPLSRPVLGAGDDDDLFVLDH